MSRSAAIVLTAGALLWAAAILVSPAALGRSSWSVPAAHLYRGAAAVCHQRPDRSFHLGPHPMPVCARCAGLYLAAAVGALFGWTAFVRRDVERSRRVLIAAAIPTALTWGLEVTGVISFTNTLRAAAALPLGAVSGWLFVGMLRYDAPLDADEIHDSRSRARRA